MEGQPAVRAIPESIGQCQIRSRLGAAGSSLLYEGVDKIAGQRLVVKVLGEGVLKAPGAEERIEREAAALKAVRHPSVVRVVDFGRTADGSPYVVSEFVEGPTLQDLIDNRAPVDHATAIAWMTQAAEGLEAAWKGGVLHRNLKPSNMLIDAQDRLRLCDFGLGEPPEESASGPAGALRGSALYASPDTAMGGRADLRSDIYSLGACFYHLLAGRPPYEASSLDDLARQRFQGPPPDPLLIKQDIPRIMGKILMRALDGEPKERFQTCEELIARLNEARDIVAAQSNEGRSGFGSMDEGDPSLGDPSLGDPSFGDPSLGDARRSAGSDADAMAAAPVEYAADEPSESIESQLDPRLRLPAPGVMIPTKLSIDEMPQSRRPLILLAIAFLMIVGGVALSLRQSGDGADSAEEAAPPPADDASGAEAEGLLNRASMERVMAFLIRRGIQKGRFPESLADLERDGVATKETLRDAWGARFRYSQSEKTLRSAGPDGEDSTADDVTLDSAMKFTTGAAAEQPAEPAQPQ